MLAYLGDPTLKTFLLQELHRHRKADEIVKGHYWENGKGCAVGCTLESIAARNGKWKAGIDHTNHALYESELGIPSQLAHLQDAIFEGLPNPDYLAWPEQFAKAIMPGANLIGVWPKFVVALLTDTHGPVWPHVQDAKWHMQLAAIERVACLFKDGMPASDASNAASDASNAASYAARYAASYAASNAASYASDAASYASNAASDAASYASDAARYAASDASYAASNAARAASYAASDAASDAAFQWQRDLLLKLLKEAK